MFHQVPQQLSEGHSSDKTYPRSGPLGIQVPGIWDLRCPWWQLAVTMLGFDFCAKFALSSGCLAPLREEDVLAQGGVSLGLETLGLEPGCVGS